MNQDSVNGNKNPSGVASGTVAAEATDLVSGLTSKHSSGCPSCGCGFRVTSSRDISQGHCVSCDKEWPQREGGHKS